MDNQKNRRWIRRIGSWSAGLDGRPRGIEAVRRSADFALKVTIIAGLLFTAEIVGPAPVLRWDVQASRLVDERSLVGPAGLDEAMSTVVRRYNERIRAREETQQGEIAVGEFHLLSPQPGSEDTTPVSLLGEGVNEVLFFSGDLSSWARLTSSEVLPIAIEAWPQLESCGVQIVALDDLYGPIACLVPSGGLVALAGSPGIPVYARELAKEADIDTADLQVALEEIERSFVVEATLTIRNDGDGNARDVQVKAPAGYEPARQGRTCRGSGVGETGAFGLGKLASCDINFETQPGSRAEIVPPSFAVTASSTGRINDNRFFVGITLAVIVMVFLLHLWFDLKSTRSQGDREP